MLEPECQYSIKACAYITRGGRELLVFESPEHEGLQIPKGTVEPGEGLREALYREVVEESGIATLGEVSRVASDVWTRRESPPKRYVRHFFHADVHEPREGWTHTVTGEGSEAGTEFEYSWVELPTDRAFALELDDYVHALGPVESTA